jgi:hypothetical protein
MRSSLNKKEFNRRLAALTSKEKDFYFISPFNSSGTPFCGTYDDRTFELTRNSFWKHVKAIVIKGEYKDAENNSTEVIYELGWTKFMTNLFLVFICLIFLALNTFLIINREQANYSLLSLSLTLNGFLLLGSLWIAIVNWVTKKIVNQRFKQEFRLD